ncbi:MAG: FG-GAP-like repeat-containing protein [Gammaproteobacteria bacterium]|nr:FG-GAP-like repeat-containing protein [Gammaproteobacteria bacterium]
MAIQTSIFGNRRVILISIVIIAIAIGFWSSSRYPTLQGKADMTGIIHLEDTLTHEVFIHVDEKASFVEKVAYTTINWAWTNRQGMTFAVFIAAAFMTLFKYLPRYRSRNRFLNSLYGLATGTPLGVCVNCVAPIAKAMYEGGRSIHTSLAVMFSSPTLNIIVLTMLFTLFPFYLALIKLAFTIFLILVIVPFISHKEAEQEAVSCAISDAPIVYSESWFKALIGIIKDYWDSFVYIVIRTVPLMFVAGFLGALVSHVWDPNTLIGTQPSLWAVVAIGIFGTFLPMPIAFDVMLAQSLFAANVPIVVVMTLLFTLGTFSIYSGFIIWRTFNFKLAVLLFLIVTALGVAAGYFAQVVTDYKEQKWEKQYTDEVLKSDLKHSGYIENRNITKFSLYGLEETTPQPIEEFYSKNNILIARSAFSEPNEDGILPFTKHKAIDLGIDSYNKIDETNFIEPFFLGRGLASGDFNNDGWHDLAVAETGGIDLFQNINGEYFKKVRLDIPQIVNSEVIFVAMADMNRDGWLDFYITTFGEDNYIALNPLANTIQEHPVRKIENGDALLTMSVSMADVNNDGWLDIFNGNWNGGEITANPGPKASNQMLLNNNLKFNIFPLSKMPNEIEGNTLTSLLTDFNQDGSMDLIVGNDFEVPDRFYINIKGEMFGQLSRKQNAIPGSPQLNMSIDSADYNNDLSLDIYMTGGSWTETPKEERAVSVYKDSQFCLNKQTTEEQKECLKIWMLSKINLAKNFKECEEMRERYGDETVRDCLVTQRVHQMKFDRKSCMSVPDIYKIYKILCNAIEDYPERVKLNNSSFIKQIPVTNILLENRGRGGFADTSEAKNAQYGAWSWAGKFADLDNDGWQDIYVTNGSVYAAFVGPTTHSPNMFFHNNQGEQFSLKHVSYGLDDFDHSSAFTYIDIDNDGDLDIIGNTTHGGLKVFKNNQKINNSIAIEINDEIGNANCIGCKVLIAAGSGDQEMKQLREIKAGGGFLSFDAPYAHFGLGKETVVHKLAVLWSTGERSVFKRDFDAGYKYTITRTSIAEAKIE